MTTRRQRRERRQKDKPVVHSAEPRHGVDHERTERVERITPEGAKLTRWDRLAATDGGFPFQTLLVVLLVTLPVGAAQLGLPRLGPPRFLLEFGDRELLVAAPFFAGSALVLGGLTWLLVRFLGVGTSHRMFFVFAAITTSLAVGLHTTGLVNAAFDKDLGHIQTLTTKQIRSGTYDLYVLTELRPGLSVPKAAYLSGCRHTGIGERCRYKIRAGALGLQWAEPYPPEVDPSVDPR